MSVPPAPLFGFDFFEPSPIQIEVSDAPLAPDTSSRQGEGSQNAIRFLSSAPPTASPGELGNLGAVHRSDSVVLLWDNIRVTGQGRLPWCGPRLWCWVRTIEPLPEDVPMPRRARRGLGTLDTDGGASAEWGLA
jgi:hypothetical protein